MTDKTRPCLGFDSKTDQAMLKIKTIPIADLEAAVAG